MKSNTIIAIGAGAILLVAATAGATAYISDMKDEPQKTEHHVTKTSTKADIEFNQPRQQAQQVPACDDDNIVGKIVGGAAGGVAGAQFGKGNGKTATTIGGTVGGALLGEEYLPTRNVTCR